MKLFYYLHSESDSIFIDGFFDKTNSIVSDQCYEIGEVKDRTVEELVGYLCEENMDDVVDLIDDDLINKLELTWRT